jgi:hypothetical protein
MTELRHKEPVSEGFLSKAAETSGIQVSMYWHKGLSHINCFTRNSMSWVAFVSLFFRILSAPHVIPGSPHDDLLQVRLALKISKGEWLGQYGELGHLTMVKPPGYPIFLAISTMSGVSPQILVHLILLIVTAMFVRQIIPKKANNARLFVYAVGVLWPIFFGSEFSRYYREGLVYVLTLTTLTLMISICHTMIDKFDEKVLASKLCALGLCLGLVLITKPIALAFAPAVCVVFLVMLANIQQVSKSIVKKTLFFFGCLFLTAAFTVLPSALVAAENFKTYKTFQVDAYSGGSFKRALSAITALPPNNRAQFEMVSNAQLETLIDVGPYSSEVAGKLLGGDLDGWTVISCSYGAACNSSGGWFMFALRDAIAMTGEDTSAVHFNNALDKIHAEIQSFCEGNGGCRDGDLAIGVKPPNNWNWFEFANSFVTVLNEIVFPKTGSSQYLARDQISPELYEEWSQMPGIPLRDSRSNFTNPVPRFLESLVPLMVVGASTFFVIIAYLKRSTDRNRQRVSKDIKKFFWCKVAGDVNTLGMIIGLGSWLCLTAQLAALQASSGIYLTSHPGTYAITCIGPFFVFYASAVSRFLKA